MAISPNTKARLKEALKWFILGALVAAPFALIWVAAWHYALTLYPLYSSYIETTFLFLTIGFMFPFMASTQEKDIDFKKRIGNKALGGLMFMALFVIPTAIVLSIGNTGIQSIIKIRSFQVPNNWLIGFGFGILLALISFFYQAKIKKKNIENVGCSTIFAGILFAFVTYWAGSSFAAFSEGKANILRGENYSLLSISSMMFLLCGLSLGLDQLLGRPKEEQKKIDLAVKALGFSSMVKKEFLRLHQMQYAMGHSPEEYKWTEGIVPEGGMYVWVMTTGMLFEDGKQYGVDTTVVGFILDDEGKPHFTIPGRTDLLFETSRKGLVLALDKLFELKMKSAFEPPYPG